MSQRTKYAIQQRPDGWEGMMEGALRASAVSKNKKVAVIDGITEHTVRRDYSAVPIQHAD